MNLCMGNSCSAGSYWIYQTCQSCTSIPCEGKCLSMQNSLYAGSSEICSNSNCYGITSMNTTVNSCSSGTDFFGNTCDCCMSAQSTLDFAICA